MFHTLSSNSLKIRRPNVSAYLPLGGNRNPGRCPTFKVCRIHGKLDLASTRLTSQVRIDPQLPKNSQKKKAPRRSQKNSKKKVIRKSQKFLKEKARLPNSRLCAVKYPTEAKQRDSNKATRYLAVCFTAYIRQSRSCSSTSSSNSNPSVSTMFSSAENIAFGIICILAACLSMTSFPVHLRAGNVAVLLMMCWCFIGLINKGINSLAFNHNLELFWTPGCDISAVIERTWQFGLCCSCFCVLHRLEGIASLRQAQSNSSDRKRRLYIDLTIGAGIPILQIPLFYIVQPYRADVIENIGCQCPLWPSVVSLFVFQLWRIVISFLCVIYAGKSSPCSISSHVT